MKWLIPNKKLSLKKSRIDIWYADLDHPYMSHIDLYRLCTDDEKKRCHQFVLDIDRYRWIVARGILRLILSHYLPFRPEEIQIGYQTYGKPYLTLTPFLQFNLSHAAGIALYAITYRMPIGIDIEKVNHNIEIHAIVDQFFSSEEKAKFNRASAILQRSIFFEIWTQKEALLKAEGKGLSSLLSARSLLQCKEKITVVTFEPIQDYLASVAFHSYAGSINYWKFAL